EIGHFIYHRAKLEACDGTSDTLAFRIDGAFYPNAQIGPREEWQANTFASNMLIPSHVLKAAQSLGITDDAELARRFNVSRAAMRIKLGLPRLDI
ncbi:MAG TPA: ImmA/IrrE family metallo-endopeptidase, partial [Phenylobacterium sp.]|uniref:ImmA/IrrE family metallo-endopeptidase n=1 Tax=Phenylobacterium sp. TaxID=1871053 RepID=UPI002B4A5770